MRVDIAMSLDHVCGPSCRSPVPEAQYMVTQLASWQPGARAGVNMRKGGVECMTMRKCSGTDPINYITTDGCSARG